MHVFNFVFVIIIFIHFYLLTSQDVQKSILSLQRDCTIFGMRCQMWMKHIKEKMSVAAVGDRSENVAAHTGNHY